MKVIKKVIISLLISIALAIAVLFISAQFTTSEGISGGGTCDGCGGPGSSVEKGWPLHLYTHNKIGTTANASGWTETDDISIENIVIILSITFTASFWLSYRYIGRYKKTA